MAKKVLIGVGIGCGVLVLLGVIGVGAVFYMGKKALGGAIEASQQMAAQEQDLQELNSSFPFTPPPEGEVLALQEARLNDYFSIREAALPIYQEMEKQSERLNEKAERGEKPSLSEGLQAGNLLVEFMAKTRTTYIEGLKKHRMSPREFHAITNAIYTSTLADSMGQLQKAMAGQRDSVEEALADIRSQLDDADLSEEERTALQEQETGLQMQLDALDEMGGADGMPSIGEKTQGVASANVALLKKFEDRIKSAYNPAFDSLIVSSDMQPGALGIQPQYE